MKILLVTTARPSPLLITQTRAAVGIPEATFDLITLDPPTEPLAVGRHLVVDRSVVPFRPLTRCSTASRKQPGSRGLRRLVRRVLTAGRTIIHRAPLPKRWRATPARMLASACATSPTARRWAASSDVVVALDDPSCWAVWELSRRADGPRYVNRPGNVKQVLSTTR